MRRQALNVWPAVADLMLILAVLSITSSVALLRSTTGSEQERQQELERLQGEIAKLETRIEELDAERTGEQEAWGRERGQYEERITGMQAEIIRNRQMLLAINAAQQLINEISGDQRLHFSPDQSLEFGSDLVDFDLNQVVPKWRQEGRHRLRQFCELVQQKFISPRDTAIDPFAVFVIDVEGHTDSIPCISDPDCNWKISAGRAAGFLQYMRAPGDCPGGNRWRLRSVAYADSRPPVLESGALAPPRRRIALRLVPDYQRLLPAEMPAP